MGFTAARSRSTSRRRADPNTGVGELLVRGPNVVRRLLEQARATAETFVDGWLHTGDLARVDDEGFVHIVDRKKDMINRGGENVYCVEVENALVEHPAVFEVAVLGVPDDMMGEKVGAVIVPRPGMTPDPAEIRAFAKSKIADFKVPQFIAFRPDPLPAQRRRQGPQAGPAHRDRVGRPGPLTSWSSLLGVRDVGVPARAAVGQLCHVRAVDVVAAVPDAGAVLVGNGHAPGGPATVGRASSTPR